MKWCVVKISWYFLGVSHLFTYAVELELGHSLFNTVFENQSWLSGFYVYLPKVGSSLENEARQLNISITPSIFLRGLVKAADGKAQYTSHICKHTRFVNFLDSKPFSYFIKAFSTQHWMRTCFLGLSSTYFPLFNPESQVCCQLKFWLPIGCAALVVVLLFGCTLIIWFAKKVSDF